MYLKFNFLSLDAIMKCKKKKKNGNGTSKFHGSVTQLHKFSCVRCIRKAYPGDSQKNY